MGQFKIAGRPLPDKGYDLVALLENMRYPPVEGWLMVNADGHGILGGLEWVRLFEVRKVSQKVEPSFHWQQICHPMVFRFM